MIIPVSYKYKNYPLAPKATQKSKSLGVMTSITAIVIWSFFFVAVFAYAVSGIFGTEYETAMLISLVLLIPFIYGILKWKKFRTLKIDEYAKVETEKNKNIIETVRKVSLSLEGPFAKKDIMQGCPGIDSKSIDLALQNLVFTKKLKKEGRGKNTRYCGIYSNLPNKEENNTISNMQPLAGIPPMYTSDFGLSWNGSSVVKLKDGQNYLHIGNNGKFFVSDFDNNARICFTSSDDCYASCTGHGSVLLNGSNWDGNRILLQHGDIITLDSREIRIMNLSLLNSDSAGKQVCSALKLVRQQLADANGIPFQSTSCFSKGNCLGICRACDEEVRYLTKCLNEKKQRGEQIRWVDNSSDNIKNIVYGGFNIDMNTGKTEIL